MRPALAALAACCVVARADPPPPPARNASAPHRLSCSDGVLLPTWRPLQDVPTYEIAIRGVTYFLALMYLFIGVSIVSDRFMAAIEVITSREKEVRVRRNGTEQIIVVRVWNETVANLTLMALGSSAPEILLSVIEIAGKNFEAGDLGPGTIVGSAAYNLFVIMAICVWVIPDGEVRKIKHLRVFLVTATWSVFAYVWLYLILDVISPSEVEVWEGLVTFLFFPTTVLTAWIADRRLLVYKYLKKGYRVNERGVIVEGEGDGSVELALKPGDDSFALEDEEGRELDKSRKEYISVLRELRRQHPEEDLETVERMALETLMSRGPKSRAFYRVAATRKMTGGGDFSRKISERAQSDLSEVKAELQRRGSATLSIEPRGACVRFDPDHYTVFENCGSFEVKVVRSGDLHGECSVHYSTDDGTAEAGSDYVAAEGTLVFGPGEVEKTFRVQVIDDDVFEEDEHFYVRLTSVKACTVIAPASATVVILDDDHSGVFSFPNQDFELTESVGTYELRVTRTAGARGKVRIPFWTEDGTAKAGLQYESTQGHVVFENNETDHGDIARPQQGAQGRIKADRLWQELGELLNSTGGGVIKTVDKWKKVWADWKAKTKKKALTMRREASGTGGGPSSRQTLTGPEERVLSLLGLTAVVGQVGIEERGFDEPPDQRNNALPPQPTRDPTHTEVPHTQTATEEIVLDYIPSYSMEVNLESTASSSLPPQLSETTQLPPSQQLSEVIRLPPSHLSEVTRLPPPQVPTPPPARVHTAAPSALSPTSRRVPRSRQPETPSPTTPRRERLNRARTRRVQTPFERATSDFVAVENRRLMLEEVRERNNHQREMERIQLEQRRIDMEEKRNETLIRLTGVLDRLAEIIPQLRTSSLPSTDIL